jgi:hypothetical protein
MVIVIDDPGAALLARRSRKYAKGNYGFVYHQICVSFGAKVDVTDTIADHAPDSSGAGQTNRQHN